MLFGIVVPLRMFGLGLLLGYRIAVESLMTLCSFFKL